MGVVSCGTTMLDQGVFQNIGAVSWNTTAITADPANAVSGTGYFANTTSAAFTITLPTSPSAGDIVAVRDYAQTFATNNLTIGRNGQPIDGQTFDLTLNTNGEAVTLVYVDGTQGWKSVNSNETINQPEFIVATGGTVTTSGDYKIHTFTGPGTFTVCSVGNPAGSNSVDYLVIAGGGGGAAGAGGAGGYRESSGTASGCYTRSPLGACVSALPVSVTGYPITVGGGGTGNSGPGGPGAANGSNSVFSTITSTGGGRTTENNPGSNPGAPGGSGGSGFSNTGSAATAGAGNTPPVSPPQGNPGGTPAPSNSAGGGGGATTAGTPGPSGGCGGVGGTSSINGTPTGRGGGGVGFPGIGTAVDGGGSGGGVPVPGGNGTANTGGGGGGGNSFIGGSGGSGIVIIRYKYQ